MCLGTEQKRRLPVYFCEETEHSQFVQERAAPTVGLTIDNSKEDS
jgi:hypothetical protein